MFVQFKKINNESGLVLFIVLMTAIVIMIFSLGVLTQSMNEVNYAQQQIDQITAEEWAKGLFWSGYANAYATQSSGIASSTYNTTMNGRAYNTAVTGSGSSVSVSTNYDTF